MDPETNLKLQQLLVQGFEDQNSLSDADVLFLRARKDYIRQRHQDRLDQIFGKNARKIKAVKPAEATPDPLAHPAAI